MTRMVDALSNIDYTVVGSEAVDFPPEIVAQFAFSRSVINTSKPICTLCTDVKDLSEITAVAELIAGGAKELASKPFMIHYTEPISPLRHFAPAVRKLLFCAEKFIPVIYAGMPQAGATAPATFAGTLAQGVAESLGGLVIHQLKNRGAPFIFGAIPTHFDMRTMILPYGVPELHLLCAATTEMAHFYDLPMFGTAGTTDAKVVDAQAAIEASLSLFFAALSGANLTHDVGQMASAHIASPEFLVLNNEIIAMLDNYFRPIHTDAESLALDIIDKVGPEGHFLSEDHTNQHYREDWYSWLFDRSRFETWSEEGGLSINEKLRDKARKILESHIPAPLPEEVIAEIQSMEKIWLAQD